MPNYDKGGIFMAQQKTQERTSVPYIVHEGSLARMERQLKRVWIALITAIVALVACNLAWLWYIYQYDFESVEYVQDGRGVNIIGDDNEVSHGTESQSSEANP